MMSAPLLHLSGVGKDYAKLDTNTGRVKLVIDLLRGRGAAHAFRALDDVSFDVAAGESLARTITQQSDTTATMPSSNMAP